MVSLDPLESPLSAARRPARKGTVGPPPRPLRRLLFLVAPGQRALYESLARTFAGDDTVEVVLDRRRAERRRQAGVRPRERRRRNRRTQAVIQRQLGIRGWAIVRVFAAPPGN